MTADLRPALKKRLQRFRKRLQNMQDEASTAQVHAFRIACRELLACYPLFNSIAPAHRWHNTVRKALKSLNRLRDLQQMQGRSTAQLDFTNALEEKIRKAENRWKKYEPALHTPGFWLALAQTEKSLNTAIDNPTDSLLLLVNSYQQWEGVLQKVNKQLRKINAEDLETLHRLRVRYKELRYLLELWLDAGIPLSADKKNLKMWQETLGEISDLRIMAGITKKLGLSPIVQLEFLLKAQQQAQLFLGHREEFSQFIAELDRQVIQHLDGEML